MIEFKAECGHTVRAKDEDAGGLVRCSYCGKPANVPENAGDDLDFLFSDVEQPAEATGRKKRKRSRAKRRRRLDEFDPKAVILRLCYGALLIMIVVVVGRKFVIPLLKGDGIRGRIAAFTAPKEGEQAQQDQPASRRPEHIKPGLIDREKLIGLYVASTPPGATVYYVAASKAPVEGRIHKIKGVAPFQAGHAQTHLSDGSYVVEVVFPWNDPRLTFYRDYMEFRLSLRGATDDERAELLEDYFVPDEGIMFVDETADQIYLVRQYRNVEVLNRQSKGVRALFLPKIFQTDGRRLSIEDLMIHYISTETAYSFDRDYVRNELRFNGVKDTDLSFVIEALSRIGVIPYFIRDRRALLFKIDMHDGSFAVRAIRGSY